MDDQVGARGGRRHAVRHHRVARHPVEAIPARHPIGRPVQRPHLPAAAAQPACHLAADPARRARRDYRARRGTPATLADLPRFDLIGFDRETPALRAALAGFPGLTRDSFALRCDNQVAQLAAIRAGFGIGVCQVGLAARDPDLVRLFPESFALPLPAWVVMHEDLRTSPRCRAVFDALVAALS